MDFLIWLVFLPILISTVLILLSLTTKRLQRCLGWLNLLLVLFILLYSWLTLSQWDLTRSQRTLSENLMIVEFYLLAAILLLGSGFRLILYAIHRTRNTHPVIIAAGPMIGLLAIVIALGIWVTCLAVDAGDFFHISG